MDCHACHIFTQKIGRHLHKHQHIHQKVTSWHLDHFRPYPFDELLEPYLYRDMRVLVRSFLSPQLFIFQACQVCRWYYQHTTSEPFLRSSSVWHSVSPEYYALPYASTVASWQPGDVVELPVVFSFRNVVPVARDLQQKARELTGLGIIAAVCRGPRVDPKISLASLNPDPDTPSKLGDWVEQIYLLFDFLFKVFWVLFMILLLR